MNRVDVRELECFVAVADHLNFSKAARQLHLSQPPMTRHIQALEEKLGTKVFTRNTHAVALTESGALFLEDARAILRHLDRATDTLRRARSGQTIRLKLAFIGALLDQKLVQLIQRFQKSHGCYQVQVTDLAPAAQLEAIQSGDLDGGFIGAKPAKPIKGVEFVEWHQEPLVLALPEGHPLAKLKSLRWQNLKSLLWVMVSRQAAPAFRHQFASIIERQSLQARIIEESDRVPAVLTMVAAGSGVSMVPQSVQHLVTGGIAFRPLPPPVPMLNYVFAFRSGEKSPALSDFVQLFNQSRRGNVSASKPSAVEARPDAPAVAEAHLRGPKCGCSNGSGPWVCARSGPRQCSVGAGRRACVNDPGPSSRRLRGRPRGTVAATVDKCDDSGQEPRAAAVSTSLAPSPARSTIRQRLTTCCGVP